MTHPLTPDQRQQWQAVLLARRAALADQRRAHRDGHSRVEPARELLLHDGDEAPPSATPSARWPSPVPNAGNRARPRCSALPR